jgi:hypothetical protein
MKLVVDRKPNTGAILERCWLGLAPRPPGISFGEESLDALMKIV